MLSKLSNSRLSSPVKVGQKSKACEQRGPGSDVQPHTLLIRPSAASSGAARLKTIWLLPARSWVCLAVCDWPSSWAHVATPHRAVQQQPELQRCSFYCSDAAGSACPSYGSHTVLAWGGRRSEIRSAPEPGRDSSWQRLQEDSRYELQAVTQAQVSGSPALICCYCLSPFQ